MHQISIDNAKNDSISTNWLISISPFQLIITMTVAANCNSKFSIKYLLLYQPLCVTQALRHYFSTPLGNNIAHNRLLTCRFVNYLLITWAPASWLVPQQSKLYSHWLAFLHEKSKYWANFKVIMASLSFCTKM